MCETGGKNQICFHLYFLAGKETSATARTMTPTEVLGGPEFS